MTTLAAWPVTDRNASVKRWLLVAAVLLFACLFQGSRPIYSPDEGRYTNVALNMLADGDWMRPMLHPEVEHWSKPPLTYWAIAASIGLFGRHEFAARLPNTLAFAATILLLMQLGRRFTPGQAWLPGVVYATCAFPFAAANIVTTDTLLTLWETLQLAAFVALWWAADARAERRARLLLWLAAGFAFMTKGPPGLLMLAGCLVFALWQMRWRGLARVCRWDGVLLFLVVGGAWYVDVAVREPGLLRYFLVEEVVHRVASDKMHRNAEWYGGFKVYLPTLLLGTVPWLPWMAWRAWRKRAVDTASTVATMRRDQVRLLACCMLLPLAVFMLSRSRLPLYVLPIFAPLALLIAGALSPLDLRAAWKRGLLVAWCLMLLGLRLLPARLDVANDDLRLATALRSLLPAVPYEVLFVETAPRFGLRFYMGSAIERLYLPNRSPEPQAEGIAEEMQEPEGCRVLLAEPSDLADLEAALTADHVAYRRLDDARGYVVLAERAPTCREYSAL